MKSGPYSVSASTTTDIQCGQCVAKQIGRLLPSRYTCDQVFFCIYKRSQRPLVLWNHPEGYFNLLLMIIYSSINFAFMCNFSPRRICTTMERRVFNCKEDVEDLLKHLSMICWCHIALCEFSSKYTCLHLISYLSWAILILVCHREVYLWISMRLRWFT